MKIITEALRSAFALLDHVPQIDALESSRFVRCIATERTLQMHLASSMLGFSEIKIKEGVKLQFHLERSALGGFLKAAVGSDITLQTGSKLLFQQGRNKLEVAMPAKVAGYAMAVPNSAHSELKFEAGNLARLQLLQKYVPRKSVDEKYSAVQGIKGFGWLATDGLVLLVHRDPKIAADVTLPLSLLLAASDGDACFRLYKDTAAYTNDHGILYQSLHADLAGFPKQKVRSLAESTFAMKPIVEIETGVWVQALTYLQGFLGESAAHIECLPGKGRLLLRLTATGIKAETEVPARIAGDLKPRRWDLEKLLPWAGSLQSKVVRLAVLEHLTAFTTETKQDLLVLVTLSQ